MNCPEVRESLPLYAYGDLPADDRQQVEAHLHDCPGCRRERDGLARLQGLLDAVPAPAARIDVSRIYQEEVLRQRHRLRRWRRAAVAGFGLAAAVLVAFAGLRALEVRWEAHQLVLRWGNPPVAVAEQPPPREEKAVPATETGPSADLEKQIQIVSELLQDLAVEAETRDRRRDEDVARLRLQLDELRRQMFGRWTATERDVAALSANQSVALKKGTVP